MSDPVNHPSHYTSHPSGVECIQVTEHMNFCVGNAVKYLWRAGQKGDHLEDLKKARWYIDREIERLEKGAQNSPVWVPPSSLPTPGTPGSRFDSALDREEAAMRAAGVESKAWNALTRSTRDWWRNKVEEETP